MDPKLAVKADRQCDDRRTVNGLVSVQKAKSGRDSGVSLGQVPMYLFGAPTADWMRCRRVLTVGSGGWQSSRVTT